MDSEETFNENYEFLENLLRINSFFKKSCLFMRVTDKIVVRGGVIEEGTALKTGRPWVRFPMRDNGIFY